MLKMSGTLSILNLIIMICYPIIVSLTSYAVEMERNFLYMRMFIIFKVVFWKLQCDSSAITYKDRSPKARVEEAICLPKAQ